MSDNGYLVHNDPEVAHAITVLCDKLCNHERATSVSSVLVVRDGQGFVFRAMDGKPLTENQDDISDAWLIQLVRGPSPT